jgi:hypothetical protein
LELEMRYVVVLVGPLLVGVVLGALFGKGRRFYALYGVGLVLGFLAVIGIYLSAPTHYDPFGCSECREHLGRWWEPDYALILVGIGYGCYLLGVWIGALARYVSQRSKSDGEGLAA